MLAVSKIGALSDLDDIAIRIADVASDLAVLGDRRRDELGSPTLPQFVTCLNIRDTDIHKAIDLVWIGNTERYRRLVGGRPASDVDDEPGIRDLNVSRRTTAVACAQNATTENRLVEASRSVDVGDGEEVSDGEPHPGGHLIALLLDLYGVH